MSLKKYPAGPSMLFTATIASSLTPLGDFRSGRHCSCGGSNPRHNHSEDKCRLSEGATKKITIRAASFGEAEDIAAKKGIPIYVTHKKSGFGEIEAGEEVFTSSSK